MSVPAALVAVLLLAACQASPLQTAAPTTASSPSDPATAGPTTAPSTVGPSVPSAAPSVAPTAVPNATAAPTESPSPQSTAAPTDAPAEGLTVDWQRLSGDPGLGDLSDSGSGSSFRNALVFRGSFYLSGERVDDDYAFPAVWSSPDGRRWQLMDLPDELLHLRDIAATRSAMVAAGDVANETGAAIWISTDGATWQRVADPDVGPHDQIVRMAASDDGFVAIGSRTWFSADGRDWQVSMDPGALELATMLVERFVRSGSSLTAFVPRPHGRVEAWRSANLSDWERVGELTGSRGVEIKAAAAGPRGWLVAGEFWQRTRRQHVWFSTDGQSWEPIEPAIGPVSDIFADEVGFFATGYANNGQGCAIDESDIQGFTWTSEDGHEWTRMPDDGFDRQRVDELLRSGRTLIGVGLTYRGNAWARGAVWTATLPRAVSGSVDGGDPLPPGLEPGGCGP